MFTKTKLTKSNLLGGYQIIGGLAGVWLTISLLTTIVAFSWLLVLILIIAFGLFGYSIFCGIIIFKNPLIGLKHSRINQFLQVFNFTIFGYGFQYISGLFISIGLDFTETFNIKLNFGTTTWQIIFNQDSEVSLVNFNIVALSLIIFIDKEINKIENKILDNELIEIGQNTESPIHSS